MSASRCWAELILDVVRDQKYRSTCAYMNCLLQGPSQAHTFGSQICQRARADASTLKWYLCRQRENIKVNTLKGHASASGWAASCRHAGNRNAPFPCHVQSNIYSLIPLYVAGTERCGIFKAAAGFNQRGFHERSADAMVWFNWDTCQCKNRGRTYFTLKLMPFYSYNDGYETKANPAGTLIRIGDVFREDFIQWVKLQ